LGSSKGNENGHQLLLVAVPEEFDLFELLSDCAASLRYDFPVLTLR